MKCRTFISILLAPLLALPVWAQTAQPQSSPSNSKSVDQIGLEVQGPQKSQAAAGEGARSTQAAPEKTISPQEAKELFKSVDEILDFASQDTKLPIKEPVKRRLVERNEVQSYIQTNMKEDKDAQRLERSEIVLKKFGLLPRNFDLQTFLVALLKEQVAGYYDPKTKTVNLLNWVDADSQRPVLAHELTHALQDQSFGLEKWMRAGAEESSHAGPPTPDDIATDEVQAARQAVVEGQAMVTLLDYSLAPTGKTLLDSPQIAEALKQGMLVGTADTPTFRRAPIFLKDTLTFPYRYGIDFTAALLNSGGKDMAFAGVFKDPPRTTREIMEPQTYLAHEKLEPLKLLDFDKDFKGYDRFDIGAMGEFDVAVLVEQYAGGDEARELYPHWRGGYYFAGRPKGDKSAPLGLLYMSRWSSPAKAAEFAAVYAKSLAQRYKRPRGLGTDGKLSDNAPPVDSWRTLRGYHVWLTEEGPLVIEVRGDTILISESVDEDTTKRVAADFWSKPTD